MPIITMLVTRRGPSCVQSPSRSRATMTCPTISPAVRLRTRRCVPVWQNEQFSVQPTWLETHSLVRPLAGVLAGQPQQPFARAVGGDLLRDDVGTIEREACIERATHLLRHAG